MRVCVLYISHAVAGFPISLYPAYAKSEQVFSLKASTPKKTAIFNLFTPVCNDSVTQFLLCQAVCDPQWIKHSLQHTISRDSVTVLFPAIEEAGRKLFTENGGQRKIGHPWSVKDMTFGRSKSFTFIALSLGPFGTRRWNREANMVHCFHLTLSSTAQLHRRRLSPVYNLWSQETLEPFFSEALYCWSNIN